VIVLLQMFFCCDSEISLKMGQYLRKLGVRKVCKFFEASCICVYVALVVIGEKSRDDLVAKKQPRGLIGSTPPMGTTFNTKHGCYRHRQRTSISARREDLHSGNEVGWRLAISRVS